MQEHWLYRQILKLKYLPFHPQWLIFRPAFFTAQIRQLTKKRVLDIGCANRWIEKNLSSCCLYIGLDYPLTGGQLYQARPDIFADATHLPIQSCSIDVVTLFEVLEHLKHPQLALQEIYRVLTPEGTLWLTVPFMYPIHDAPYDYQRLTEFGLQRDLETAGFTDVLINKQLSAVESSCLLLNIALGGSMLTALKEKRIVMLLLPLIIFVILLINVTAYICAKILPDWQGMTVGYSVTAKKAPSDIPEQ